MTRRFWLALDRLGHALPLVRFGRARYAICLRADRYMEQVETAPPTFTVSSGQQTWSNGTDTTWTWR